MVLSTSLKEVQSRCFELFWPRTGLPFKFLRKPEISSLLQWKSTKEIIIINKGTRMIMM